MSHFITMRPPDSSSEIKMKDPDNLDAIAFLDSITPDNPKTRWAAFEERLRLRICRDITRRNRFLLRPAVYVLSFVCTNCGESHTIGTNCYKSSDDWTQKHDQWVDDRHAGCSPGEAERRRNEREDHEGDRHA